MEKIYLQNSWLTNSKRHFICHLTFNSVLISGQSSHKIKSTLIAVEMHLSIFWQKDDRFGIQLAIVEHSRTELFRSVCSLLTCQVFHTLRKTQTTIKVIAINWRFTFKSNMLVDDLAKHIFRLSTDQYSLSCLTTCLTTVVRGPLLPCLIASTSTASATQQNTCPNLFRYFVVFLISFGLFF